MRPTATVPLKRLVNPRRPITYGIVQAGEDVEGGVPYVRPVDMRPFARDIDPSVLRTTSSEIAEQYRRSTIREGDLVVSIGPSYGKLLLVPRRLAGANLTQGTARVAPARHVDARFLQWALASVPARAYWDAAVGGATFGGLNLRPLARTPLRLMSSIDQVEVADFLDRECGRLDELGTFSLPDSSDTVVARFLTLLAEYRDALITEAVTGKLDVTRLSDSQVDESAQAAMEGERPEVLSP